MKLAATSEPGKLLKLIEDVFMSQILSEPVLSGALLGLLFGSRGCFVGEVTGGGCFGHRNHETVEFQVFGVMQNKVSRVAAMGFKRANS